MGRARKIENGSPVRPFKLEGDRLFLTSLDKFRYVAHHGRRESDCRTFSIANANRRYPRSVRKSASLFLPHGRNLFPFRTIRISFQLRKSMRANLFNSRARSSRSCFRSGKKNGKTVSHMPMLQNMMSGQHALEG